MKINFHCIIRWIFIVRLSTLGLIPQLIGMIAWVHSGQKTQSGSQKGNRLLHTACKSWRLWNENGAIFSAGENPYSSSDYQIDSDLQAKKMKRLVSIPYIYIAAFQRKKDLTTAKWVFLEKSLCTISSKVQNYLSRPFLLLLEVCVNKLISLRIGQL